MRAVLIATVLFAGACAPSGPDDPLRAGAGSAVGSRTAEGATPDAAQALAVSAKANDAAVTDDGQSAMVWIEGGVLQMGSPDGLFPDALPVHEVRLDGFWIDRTEVTNTQFASFVAATGYVTVAEQTPRAEDYPGVPAENLVAGSIVFTPPDHAVALHQPLRWWSYMPGANWRRPEGPGSTIEGRLDHPVVHVAWDDVVAYAQWAGKRLPTEAEWEWAARGGLVGTRFVWGDAFQPDGVPRANLFQGRFPHHDTGADGFTATSPVKAFPPNRFGLYGMAGNVWEWTADWYRPDTYARRAGAAPVDDPRGPAEEESYDPAEPGLAKRVQRGGSFLCTDQYCSRYRPDGRGKGAPDSGTNHLGFRLVSDP